MKDASTRRTWSDADLGQLEWHDVQVHGYAVVPERYLLVLDIDYIAAWNPPTSPGGRLSFQVAPATLTFENVMDVELQLKSSQGDFSLQELRRDDERRIPGASVSTWRWVLVLHEGEMRFRASGFKLSLRSEPVHSETQSLGTEERGGISFEPSAPLD